jgi:hypothetical protein
MNITPKTGFVYIKRITVNINKNNIPMDESNTPLKPLGNLTGNIINNINTSNVAISKGLRFLSDSINFIL